jgi:hypothetical protein
MDDTSKRLNESDATILARIEVASNPPKLRDFHEVDERLEPTEVIPIPPDYEQLWRAERPTVPLPYHAMPIEKLPVRSR